MKKDITNYEESSIPTFTMRDFLRNPKRASALLRHGQKINVTNNGVLLFVATPPQSKETKRIRGHDFQDLILKGSETDLSSKVDELVYGT